MGLLGRKVPLSFPYLGCEPTTHSVAGLFQCCSRNKRTKAKLEVDSLEPSCEPLAFLGKPRHFYPNEQSRWVTKSSLSAEGKALCPRSEALLQATLCAPVRTLEA